MDKKRILKKTGLYFIGNLSTKLLSAILVPLYAFYVNAEDLGAFDYSQTLLNIVVPIAFLCVWEAVLKFVLAEEDNKMIKKVMVATTFFSIFIALALLIFMNIYGMLIKDDYIKYVSIMFVVYGISTIWQYYARAIKENELYIKSAISGTAINLLANIVMLCIFNMGLEALYISYILSCFTIFIVIEVKLKVIKNLNKKDFNIKILKKMLAFSIPLVINTISIWLISGVGRIFTTNYLGTEANGLYAFSNKFSIILTFIGSVTNMAIIEESIIAGKENSFNSSFSNTMQLIFEKWLQLLIVAVPVICIFYFIIQNTEYYASRLYFPLILIYTLFMNMSTNVGSVFQAIDKTKYVFWTTLLGGIITIIISWGAIKLIGIYAILIGQMLGALVMLVYRYFLVKKFTGMKIYWRNFVIYLIIFGIISYILLNVNFYLNILGFILIFIIVLYLNREYILSFKNIVLDKIRKR